MENKRSTRLLLGLVLAFSLLLAGLEYTSSPTDSDMDSEMFEDLVQDMEVVPNDRKDMISAVSAPASHAVAARVKPVEAAVSSPEKLNPNTGTQPVGDGGGAVDAAKVTEALPQTAADDEKAKDFRIVQQLPEFPGGWVEFMKWLTKILNIRRRLRVSGYRDRWSSLSLSTKTALLPTSEYRIRPLLCSTVKCSG